MPILIAILFVAATGRSVAQNGLRGSHPDSVVVLRFGGDCLLADHYEATVGESVALAFDGFTTLQAADIAIVNLECPVTTRGRKINKPYNFRMHPRFLKALTSAGIDIVNIANNHIFDYGRVGLFDTISYLDSAGILHVGAGRNAREARMPVIVARGGRRIAFMGYYGGGEAPAATASSAGVAERAIGTIQSDIADIRTQNSADFVVVNLHWGTEKARFPDSDQIEFAHQVVDAGADVVIGHHPHVLQGVERYKGGVIAYSLGNFVFGGNSNDTYDTALLEVRLASSGVEYSLIPLRVERWRVGELMGAEGERVLQHVKDLSSRFPKNIFPDKEAR